MYSMKNISLGIHYKGETFINVIFTKIILEQKFTYTWWRCCSSNLHQYNDNYKSIFWKFNYHKIDPNSIWRWNRFNVLTNNSLKVHQLISYSDLIVTETSNFSQSTTIYFNIFALLPHSVQNCVSSFAQRISINLGERFNLNVLMKLSILNMNSSGQWCKFGWILIQLYRNYHWVG